MLRGQKPSFPLLTDRQHTDVGEAPAEPWRELWLCSVGSAHTVCGLRCVPLSEVPFVTTPLLYDSRWSRRRKRGNVVLDQCPGSEAGGRQEELDQMGILEEEGKAQWARSVQSEEKQRDWLAPQPTQAEGQAKGRPGGKAKANWHLFAKTTLVPGSGRGITPFVAHSCCRRASSSKEESGCSQCGCAQCSHEAAGPVLGTWQCV